MTLSTDSQDKPTVPDIETDPYGFFEHMRKTAPVWRGTLMESDLMPEELKVSENWTLFDFESVFAAFREDTVFASEMYNNTIGLVFGPTILGMHGKQHHDHRSLVSKAFKQNAALDGSLDVDEGQLRKFLQYFLQQKFLDAGVGIIINPEAGELFYLSREEKLRNVQITLEEVKGRVPVFAGVCQPTTAATVQEAQDAIKAGADGIFAMPAIGALDVTTAWDSLKYPEVWLDNIKAIAKGIGDKPIICHPVGTLNIRYGEGLPVEVAVQTCKEVPNVVGWKMTYNYTGFRIVSRALRRLDHHVAILGAPSVNFHENMANDAFDGTVTGSWNYSPEPMLEHILAWRKGDWRGALKIWQDRACRAPGVRLLRFRAAPHQVQDRHLASRLHLQPLHAAAPAEAQERRGEGPRRFAEERRNECHRRSEDEKSGGCASTLASRSLPPLLAPDRP